MRLRREDIHELHCIVPLVNVPSITRLGILSHQRAKAIYHRSVASPEVQRLRAGKSVPNGRPLHHYANLYIDARNPMMYVLKELHNELCVLRVSCDVLDLPGVVIASGNAARGWTRFAPSPSGLAMIERDLVFAERWNGSAEAKSVRCAEVLVPDSVSPTYLLGAYVSCREALEQFVRLDLTEPRVQATIREQLFYR